MDIREEEWKRLEGGEGKGHGREAIPQIKFYHYTSGANENLRITEL